jgi:hypothetical protein
MVYQPAKVGKAWFGKLLKTASNGREKSTCFATYSMSGEYRVKRSKYRVN